jgi:hypothetical protein
MVSQPPAASCSTVPPSASTASFTVCWLPSAIIGEGNAAELRTTCACCRASAQRARVRAASPCKLHMLTACQHAKRAADRNQATQLPCIAADSAHCSCVTHVQFHVYKGICSAHGMTWVRGDAV